MRPGRCAGAPRAAALLLGAALVLPGPRPAGAWMPATHRQIAADALELLSPQLRDALRPSLDLVADGSTFPDTIVVGGEHHSWCPDRPCGDAPDWIAAELQRVLDDFRPRSAAGHAARALSALFPAGCSATTAGPLGLDPELDASLPFRLGALGHYLADLAVPYHTLPYEPPWKARHLAFEDEVDARRHELAAAFDGRRDDVAAAARPYAVGLALAAHRELDLVDDPEADHGSRRFLAAVDRCYARAVNAVADLWESVLRRVPPPARGAGGPPR